PIRTDPCRSPSQATGASWQSGSVAYEGNRTEGWYCNVVNGVTGDLEFDLAARYSTFDAFVGLSDESSTGHLVLFEVFGDDRPLLASPPTVDFAGGQRVHADVSGVR